LSLRVRKPLVAALTLAIALVVACSGGGDEPGEGPPGPAANATQSTLLRASADSPSGAGAPTATPTVTATATAAPTATPVPRRTAAPGCAQGATAPPSIYYGFGLTEGEVVMAFNTRPGCEQIICEQTEVDGDGFWVLRVAGDNVCGVQQGDGVIFTIDGEVSAVTTTWSAGRVPEDVQRGMSLRPQ